MFVDTQPQTRPASHGLILARIGWLALCALMTALFAADLWFLYAELLLPCGGASPCVEDMFYLTAAEIAALHAHGSTASVYAAAQVGLYVVFFVVHAALATLIFWRRSDDRMALFVAAAMLLWSAMFPDMPKTLWQTLPALAVVLVVGESLGGLGFYLFLFFVSLIATGVIAVLFQPLRARLQRGVNRLLYGERDDPYAALARLGQRLEATLAPDAVLPTIVQTVREALKLPYAAIALGQGDELVIAVEAGDGRWEMGDGESTKPQLPTPNSHLPLMYQGELLGELRLAPRGPNEPFSSADRRLLDDLARQAGVAAHAVCLTADLQRARERLVAAREEERRRIRRDLHDGLGPQLASQTLTIDAVFKLLPHDTAAAIELLRHLKAQSQEAIADIRRLVYALRPPALDDLGLVAALREYAAQYGQSGVQITITSPEPLPSLPAAVEVAVYRIVQEALTNVIKHAQARACAITLALGDGLEVTIADDGRGLRPDRRGGVGTASMQERAAELGGRLTIEPRPGGGTRVHAWLPRDM